MEETVKEMKEFCKRVLRGEAKNLQETAILPQILELLKKIEAEKLVGQ